MKHSINSVVTVIFVVIKNDSLLMVMSLLYVSLLFFTIKKKK